MFWSKRRPMSIPLGEACLVSNNVRTGFAMFLVSLNQDLRAVDQDTICRETHSETHKFVKWRRP